MLPLLKNPRDGWQLSVAVLVLVALVLGALPGVPAVGPSAAAPNPGPSSASDVSTPSLPSSPHSPFVPTASPMSPGQPSELSGPRSNFHLAQTRLSWPHPSAWGKSGLPPGWIVPASGGNGLAAQPAGTSDPVIEFYSAQNGSGGNVSWDVTLPVDRNATANQSDLYEAVEFGITVTAPSAWMGECFLQLQLYPDASYYGTGRDNGNWIGYLVGWQLQTTTGAEDPCFHTPLYLDGLPGSGFLNLTQGDRINVTMTGWPGDPAGELVSIEDLTHTANQSYAYAFNSTGNYPLDPAYSANDVQDAFQWGTGGDYPVLFGVLTGRGGNPTIPDNNSVGGCSPGPPPPTASNGAVPCPSYDPGSWINDTLHPWLIDPPTFFNGTARSGRPAQVAFSQAYGGSFEIANSQGTACAGLIGSAYCSYPWFSYSCGAHAFEFGATDYPGVSDDFGKFFEYAQSTAQNAAGLVFYPSHSYSVPTCGGPAYTVRIGPSNPGGSVIFLNQTYTGITPVKGLAPGEYQLQATHAGGSYFGHWAYSGGVVPSSDYGSWTTVTVTGGGSIYAVYNIGTKSVSVTFSDSPSGEIALTGVPTPYIELGATMTIPDNGVIDLETGIYSILAYPPQGFIFSAWSSSGPGIVVASPSLMLTFLIVTGAASTGSVTATYLKSALGDHIELEAFDTANSTSRGGTVSLGGFLTTHSRATSGSIPVGTYNLTAKPDPGFTFDYWYYSPSAIMLNFSAVTNVTLENGTFRPGSGGTGIIPENGTGYIVAEFTPNPVPVTFSVASGSGGIDLSSYGYMTSGTVQLLIPGVNYTVSAAPAGDNGFISWEPVASSTIWNRESGKWTENLVVNSSGTVQVTYGPGLPETVTFHVAPAGAGKIGFNVINTYLDGATNTSVTGGETYLDVAIPSAGYTFSRWGATGGVTVNPATAANSTVMVSSSGDLNATFVPTTYPVTVLTNSPRPSVVGVDGVQITVGSTLRLAPGNHLISISTIAGTVFDSWSTSGGTAVSAPNSNATTFTVTSSGAVTALITPFAVGLLTITPSTVDVGVAANFLAPPPTGGTYVGYTPTWAGLPPGCPSGAGRHSVTCAPTAAGTYSVSATFTDAWGAQATSPLATLLVNPDPAISGPTLSFPAVDIGLSTNVSAVESGGTAPFTWSYGGLPSGCLSVNDSQLTCSASAVGTFNITVNVTDKFGVLATGTVELVVNSLPSIQITASSTSASVGDRVTITSVASGGTGPESIGYANLPPGCPATNLTTFTCSLTTAGTYHVTVTVADAFGKSATSTVTITVAASSSPVVGLSYIDLSIGLLLLVIIAVVTYVLLGRRPKAPTIVVTRSEIPPTITPPLPPVRRPAPSTPVPEWSEEPAPPPQEWQEGE